MLFNSLEYLCYLPIVFLLYWYVFRGLIWQNLFIVVASYVFYGWWDRTFLLLIAFTTLCSYLSGLRIGRFLARNQVGKAKVLCVANITVNLVVLGVYKYYDFFVDSFVTAFSAVGLALHPSSLNLILPVGISFYTFQALSYSIDVYRRKIQPSRDIIAFFAFISFFPQLVAGPIERATNLLPQFQKLRIFKYEEAVDGTRQILWGVFKKVVIADNCAITVNEIFADYESLGTLTLLYGAFMFSFQIYGDFSGYSDIAIGTSKLFGVHLMQNFRFPYFSRSIPEFWRRWHISLNTWFTDYLYIPLGGSRCTYWKVVRNTFIVFVVSGLWHGANWTFICWGIFHGVLFLPYLLFKKNTKSSEDVAVNHFFPSFREFSQILVTYLLVIVGWIIFRAKDISEAIGYIVRMSTQYSFEWGHQNKKTTIFILFMLFLEWIQRKQKFGLQLETSMWPPLCRYALYCFLLFAILLFSGESTQFIYFQF